MRRPLLLLGAPAAWSATMAWLLGPAATRFPLPPVAASKWGPWWETTDPLDAMCALARLGCVAIGGVLLLLVVAALLARILDAQVWSRRIAAITPSIVSTFVAAAVAAGAPPAGADTLPAPFLPAVEAGEGATMTVVEDTTPTTTTTTTVPATTTAPPVTIAPAEPTSAAAPTVTVEPAPDPAAVAATSVVVAPGDHFWSIARRRVGDALGRAPTDAEVAGYWRRLVAVNADRLVEPGNPDLLEVGQVLRLP